MMPADQEAHQRAAALRRMKRLPLFLLLLMAALFFATAWRTGPWSGWIHAFAEAAMVGALADWFAVVALFRHPLGLPIPHTAIIPRRKNEIGQNLATFIADHFLDPQAVRSKLESVNLACQAALWVQTPLGQSRVVDSALGILTWSTKAWKEAGFKQFLKRFSRHQLQRIDFSPLLGRTLDWLVHDGRHQQLLTQVLRYGVVLLSEHGDTLRSNVQQESPWWMPGFVDDRIVKQMLERVENLLLQMSLDPQHPVRLELNSQVERWASELQNSPELKRAADQLRQSALDNKPLHDYLYALWSDLVTNLEEDIARPDSMVRQELAQFLHGLASELAQDEDMQAVVNRWLVNSAVVLVGDNRHAIASLVSDTVAGWDARDTSERVELAIGKDLQFIRINGTLVGGLVGLVIHAFYIWGPGG